MLSRLQAVIDATRSQVATLVIVDNGSDDAVKEWLRAQSDIVLLEQSCNQGIAAAHNIGIRWAVTNSYSHILLLDQDSIPSEDMVTKLVKGLEWLRQSGIDVSAVGPRFRDMASQVTSYFVRFDRLKIRKVWCQAQESQHPVPASFLISSGALIPLDTLAHVGEMDEKLFMDHVDTEWFLRASHMGFHPYGICDALMTHSLGTSNRSFWFLGRRRYIPVHSPLRCYYMFRNSILLYRRDYVPLLWITSDLLRRISLLAFYLLFMRRSGPYMPMIKTGVYDGWRGITGPFNSPGRAGDER